MLLLCVAFAQAADMAPLFDKAEKYHPEKIKTWDVSTGPLVFEMTPDILMFYICFPKNTEVINLLEDVKPVFKVDDIAPGFNIINDGFVLFF